MNKQDMAWGNEDFMQEVIEKETEAKVADVQEKENPVKEPGAQDGAVIGDEDVINAWNADDFVDGSDKDEAAEEVDKEVGGEEVVEEEGVSTEDGAVEEAEPQTEEKSIWSGEIDYLKGKQKFEIKTEEQLKEIVQVYLNNDRLSKRLAKYEDLKNKMQQNGVGDKHLDDMIALVSGEASPDIIAKYMKHNKIDYVSDEELEKAQDVSKETGEAMEWGKDAGKVLQAYVDSYGGDKTNELLGNIQFYAQHNVLPANVIQSIFNGDKIVDGSYMTYTNFFLEEADSGMLHKVMPALSMQIASNPKLRVACELDPSVFVQVYDAISKKMQGEDSAKPSDVKPQGGQPNPPNKETQEDKTKSMRSASARIAGAVPTGESGQDDKELQVLLSGDIKKIKEHYANQGQEISWR